MFGEIFLFWTGNQSEWEKINPRETFSAISHFISKCKENEDENGFIKSTFFDFKKNIKYQFISGPFTNMIFNIIQENKLSIKAIIGNYAATVSKDQNLFRPV